MQSGVCKDEDSIFTSRLARARGMQSRPSVTEERDLRLARARGMQGGLEPPNYGGWFLTLAHARGMGCGLTAGLRMACSRCVAWVPSILVSPCFQSVAWET